MYHTVCVLQWVKRYHEPAFINDAVNDERIDHEANFGFDVRSVMAIPLFFDDSSEHPPVSGVLEGARSLYCLNAT